MLVTVSSVAGSPGATSWALLLAAAWPSTGAPTRIVVEADCAGGVLGARYGLGVDPGAMTLLSACRRHADGVDVADHGRRLADGLWLVPGSELADHAVPAWSSCAADVAGWLAHDRRLWVIDGGRIGPDSPLRPLAEAAQLNLVVSRPGTEDLLRLPARLALLGPPPRAAVVLVGSPAQPRRELHRFLGGATVWIAPESSDLPRLAAGAVAGGRSRRSGVWRAAVDLAAEVSALTGRLEDQRVRSEDGSPDRPWDGPTPGRGPGRNGVPPPVAPGQRTGPEPGAATQREEAS